MMKKKTNNIRTISNDDYNAWFLKNSLHICSAHEAYYKPLYEQELEKSEKFTPAHEELLQCQLALLRLFFFRENLEDPKFVDSLGKDLLVCVEGRFSDKEKINDHFHNLMKRVINGKIPFQCELT